MAKGKKTITEETKIEESKAPAKDQRSFITMATEGETISSRVKTTRELYMEIVDGE